ncbi:MAG TPA: serine/threonine-protein kinase [Polyangiaceae bacterium]|nr:serine/threonine-protein kinase [Polyangiaceae bacterium]
MKYCEQCGAAFRYSRTCPKDGVAVSAGSGDPLIGRVLGDRYRILERIGAGGMGQVYRAAHTRIACIFAIKVVWGDLAYDPQMQVRFIREAETASCLQSRYIVRVNDFGGDDNSLPYLVMEHLDGPILHDVIVREGPLAPARAARIAERIARGLAHAHSRGVVHRDLKPENVLLVRDDDEPDVCKLLDFGIARLEDAERLTAGGVVVGTPLYMAPEQFTGAAVDGRTDLYALGCVLHEMLSGKPPFDAQRIEDLTKAHLTEEPPRLSRPGAIVSPALEAIVRRLMAKRPEDRFASAREVAQALARAADEPERGASLLPPVPGPVSLRSQAGGLRETIERVILEGAPRYNSGDHAGCAALYRACAEDLSRRFPEPIAIAARLEAAMRRAATRQSPTEAAWDLRYAFDDLLLATPSTPSGTDEVADELGAFNSVAAVREAEGRLDLLGDYEIAFARALSRKLAADPARRHLAQTLESAAQHGDQVGGGAAAIHAVEPLLSSLRARRAGAPSIVAPLSAQPNALAAASPAKDDVKQRIARAIAVGAPAFNEGKPDACARLYREAAMDIVAMCGQDPKSEPIATLMRKALGEAQGKTPNDAAWVLRYAFDAVLAS